MRPDSEARRPGPTSPSDGRARFAYHPAIIERFPTVVGGVIHAVGLVNGPSSASLTDAFETEQAAVRARIGETPLSELPSLASWRRTFRAFGVDPTTYRSAAEALLRRLTKQGSIPSISALVDVGNLVSIRHALPVRSSISVALPGRRRSGSRPAMSHSPISGPGKPGCPSPARSSSSTMRLR